MSVIDDLHEIGPEPEELVGASASGPTGRLPQLGRRRLAAVGLAALALVGGLWAWRSRPPVNPAIDGTTSVSAEELESVYGAKVDLVALLANGGLIELRFQVVDKDKARALFGDVEDMPKLAVEDSELVLQSAKGMGHKFELVNGGSYFILYPNPADAVHKGTEVSFVMNGYRLPHLVVQK